MKNVGLPNGRCADARATSNGKNHAPGDVLGDTNLEQRETAHRRRREMEWTGEDAVLDECSPALAAIESDDVAALRGFDGQLDVPTTSKTYAIHEACEHGSLRVVEYLVSTGLNSVSAVDGADWTPLHFACVFQPSRLDLIHFLLANGADIAARDSAGDTALCALRAEEDLDQDGLLVLKLLEAVERAGSYDAWARAHVNDAAFSDLIAEARPNFVAAETRMQIALVNAQCQALQQTNAPGEPALDFVFGRGHPVFAHVLAFLA